MVSPSDLIDLWQRERFLLGRQCRILNRLKHITERQHTVVSGQRGTTSGLHFSCQTEADAMEIAAALRIDLKLQWVKHVAVKQADHESDDLIFTFVVCTPRPVHYDDCVLQYAKRNNTSGSRRCKMMFAGHEMEAHNFPSHSRLTKAEAERVKRQLWSLMLTRQKAGHYSSYVFSAPF